MALGKVGGKRGEGSVRLTFENCSTIKTLKKIIRFLLYVTFTRTESFSLRKKILIVPTIVHYQSPQIKLQENWENRAVLSYLNYLNYLLKLSEEKK